MSGPNKNGVAPERSRGVLLALDCSLRWTNAAVFEGKEALASERLDIGRRQAAELPLAVERVLVQAGRSFGGVGLIAVTNGPGYFTGIRVGVSYASALSYGLGVQIVPVSTLHMLAYPYLSPAASAVLAVARAGQERLYAASFGGNTAPLAPGEYGRKELEAWLSARGDITVVSDDPENASDVLPGRRIQSAPPDAAAVAKIAWAARETAVSPMNLRVSYHRSPV
jgi:tRNA threonylcarbamoyladenosine biosynthesis protein TsaB